MFAGADRIKKIKFTIRNKLKINCPLFPLCIHFHEAGRVAQLLAHMNEESAVPGSIPGPAIYFREN